MRKIHSMRLRQRILEMWSLLFQDAGLTNKTNATKAKSFCGVFIIHISAIGIKYYSALKNLQYDFKASLFSNCTIYIPIFSLLISNLPEFSLGLN